jgi:hypothetical protein
VRGNRRLDPRTEYNREFADRHSQKRSPCADGRWEQRTEIMRTGLLRPHNSLTGAKIQPVLYESQCTDHEWQTWRHDLKYFAPRLF